MNGETLYEELCDDLLARYGDLERAQMGGLANSGSGADQAGTPAPARLRRAHAVSLKRNDKLSCFSLADAHARAPALDGTRLFDPGGPARPVAEWMVVPDAHSGFPRASEHAARDGGLGAVGVRATLTPSAGRSSQRRRSSR